MLQQCAHAIEGRVNPYPECPEYNPLALIGMEQPASIVAAASSFLPAATPPPPSSSLLTLSLPLLLSMLHWRHPPPLLHPPSQHQIRAFPLSPRCTGGDGRPWHQTSSCKAHAAPLTPAPPWASNTPHQGGVGLAICQWLPPISHCVRPCPRPPTLVPHSPLHFCCPLPPP
jgi:hypothetical protein